MKEKITQLFSNLVSQIKPILTIIDEKINTLMPNLKLKKILYIGVGSLFGFMFLIILLGLLLSPLRNQGTSNSGIKLNRPSIINASPEPQKELTETQKEISKLETRIKELKFPESTLNMPVLEDVTSI